MITAFRLKRTLASVLDCLDRERDLMVSGDLLSLSQVVEEREQLVESLGIFSEAFEPQHAPMIGEIKARSQRNASLMEASMTGLRDAETLMNRIREQQSRLGTYDEGGKVSGTAVTRPRHEKRA